MAKKKATKKASKKATKTTRTTVKNVGKAQIVASDPAPAAPPMPTNATAPMKKRATNPRKNDNPHVVIPPTYEQIAARAFVIWELKGKPAGQDEANWREAEAELLAENGG